MLSLHWAGKTSSACYKFSASLAWIAETRPLSPVGQIQVCVMGIDNRKAAANLRSWCSRNIVHKTAKTDVLRETFFFFTSGLKSCH